ncbi:MAG: hypothetical protein ABUS54_05060 [Actinomycetota bacterium]
MTILCAALLAAAAAALGVPAAQASPAALQQATSNCWLDVINDWLDNNQVDNLYAIPCYTQAIQHLNALPDVKGYSSAIDDIHRALLAAIHQEHSDGPGGGGPSGGGNGGPSGPSSNGGGPSGPTSSPTANHPTAPFGGTASATSIPLPLIVLGGLAILLALAALGTWLARRYQGRRPNGPRPAPAVAKRR